MNFSQISVADIPAIGALLVGFAYTLPQLRKSFRKNAHVNDIALGSWWLLLLGEVFWGANAVIHQLPINFLSCVVNVLLIVCLLMRLLYLKRQERTAKK